MTVRVGVIGAGMIGHDRPSAQDLGDPPDVVLADHAGADDADPDGHAAHLLRSPDACLRPRMKELNVPTY